MTDIQKLAKIALKNKRNKLGKKLAMAIATNEKEIFEEAVKTVTKNSNKPFGGLSKIQIKQINSIIEPMDNGPLERTYKTYLRDHKTDQAANEQLLKYLEMWEKSI